MLRSNRIAKATGLTVIDKVIAFVKGAGAKKESAYDRDGFLSYHAESHAAGAGTGIGFVAGSSGNLRMLGGILTLVLYGNNGDSVFGGKLFKDIRQELHYFIGGLFFGAMMGIVSRIVMAYMGLVA